MTRQSSAQVEERQQATQKRSVEPSTQATLIPIYGSVFLPGRDPTQSLYQMFANMNGKKVPDPDFVIRDMNDIGNGPPKLVPAHVAFVKHVENMWILLMRSGIPHCNKVYDSILHRTAYVLVMEDWEENPGIMDWRSPADFIVQEHEKKDGKGMIYNNMLGALQDIYEKFGYGWDETLVWGLMAWNTEVAHMGKKNARKYLFPQYESTSKRRGKKAEALEKSVFGSKEVRHDPPHTSPVELPVKSHPILQSISQKIGEQRYDLWFGNDTQVREEDGKTIFTVRNSFAINSIKRHCSDVLPPGSVFEVREQKLTESEIKAVQSWKAHELCNALENIRANKPEKYDAVLATLTPFQRHVFDNLKVREADLVLT